MIGHPSNWLSIMGSNLFHEAHALNVWLVKTILQPLRKYACSLTVISFRCLHHQAMSLWSMHNCFIPKSFCDWSNKLRHAKVSTGKLTCVQSVPSKLDNDSYIVTKGAPVQAAEPWQITNLHKALADRNFRWPCTTSLSITQRANSCSNGRQWKSFVYGFNNDLFLKNLDIAGLPYWFTWRHLDTFRCSYCTAAYQRHWQHSGQNMHQYSALISQSMLPQSLKLQLSSEDAHSCDRFSNLISNVLGLIHLPIIYVHEAILEHQLFW